VFEDIIGQKQKQKKSRNYPTRDEIIERCSSCAHADVRSKTPHILCTIGGGIDCTGNLETLWAKYQRKDKT
jgi:hypothetical protein